MKGRLSGEEVNEFMPKEDGPVLHDLGSWARETMVGFSSDLDGCDVFVVTCTNK